MILKKRILSLTSRSYLRNRRFATSNSRRIEDEGDWFYSSEWWDNGDSDHNTVFRSVSDKGNGVVSVVASHSSRPNESHWHKTENWLSKRYAELHPTSEENWSFKVLGYQWRTLRFNDETRQSTAKVMAAYKEQDPGSIFLRQEPDCLAVPYVKSMVSVGLASLAFTYDLIGSIYEKNIMNVLCIGHGGGSLPLFLASNIRGSFVHIVEIDPVVISASTQAMGFPAYPIVNRWEKSTHSKPNLIDEVLWGGVHERLFLYESDAEKFIADNRDLYDLVFVDAYDGDDIFPQKLWDPDSSFLKDLSERLHPEHGTVVVNLHLDADMVDESIAPMGKYVARVAKSYKKVLLDDAYLPGFAYTVNVPWVCNTSLVVSRTFTKCSRDTFLNSLISGALKVENILKLPFSFLQYVKRRLVFVD